MSPHTRAYYAWTRMKHRCKGYSERDWKYYTSRGITYEPRWEKFENFYADMGGCPEGLTLERIDNDAGYSKSNCKWATRAEQALNRSNSVLTARNIELVQKAAEWKSPKSGLPYTVKEISLTCNLPRQTVLKILTHLECVRV